MCKRNLQKVLVIGFIVLMLGLVGCQSKNTKTETTNNTKTETTNNAKEATQTEDKEGQSITVSAAASLTDALDKLQTEYKKPVQFNYGSSGALRTQIESGAPADVFVSASKEHVTKLEEKGLVKESQDLLKNKLVIVGKEDLKSIDDIANLDKFAIGDPESVPAGKYAKEALTNLGFFDKMQDKFVLGTDVRQVLEWVKSGEVPYGIVYKTDALVAKDDVKIVYEFEPTSHKDIIYPIALLSDTPEAKEFYEYLKGDEAKKVFEEFGYEVIDGANK